MIGEDELNEKKERIVESYSKLFDLSLAYDKNGTTQEERKLLDEDESFQGRIKYFLIKAREDVFHDLKDIADCGSKDDNVRLRAILELGKIVYPQKFVEGYNDEDGSKSLGKIEVNHNLTINKDGYAAEILKILSESGGLQSTVEGDSSS